MKNVGHKRGKGAVSKDFKTLLVVTQLDLPMYFQLHFFVDLRKLFSTHHQ